MANLFLFSNFASSMLAGPISPTATSLAVASGTGAEFPQPNAGQQFAAVLNDAATGLLYEVLYCQAVVGDTFNNLLRGQEGSTALSWVAGDLIANVVTAGQMAAMIQAVSVNPIRTVTTSGAFTITTADAGGTIGMNRTSAVAPSSATLPSNASPAQSYTIQDVVGNFQANPVTINAPGGQSIAGLSQKVLNVNRGSWTFTYYGSNLWGISGP